LESIPNDLHRILGPDERVLMHIRQKIYHKKLTIESITITNERIILRHPHAAKSGEGYTAYSYHDISDVALERGVIGSTIRCNLRTGGQRLSLYDLPSSSARRAYSVIKENLMESRTPYATIGAALRSEGQPN
jgi:Bacterial PH domain